MFEDSCIFCKIIQKKIPCTIIQENEHILVIKDLSPRAPIHYLIIPKNHINDINSLNESTMFYGTEIFKIAQKIGSSLQSKSFNLISNNGAAAGQSIFHLHIHFLAGTNVYEQGLRL